MGFMDKIQKFLPERFRKKKDPVEGLKENRLAVPCFDTSVDLADPAADLAAVRGLIVLAKSAETPYVALFASQNNGNVTENLRSLLPAAEKSGVTLLLKTTGAYADTSLLRVLLEDAKGVLA